MMLRSTVLTSLLDQHAHLRALMAACERLSVEGAEAHQLVRAVVALRVSFAAHNAYEEAVLRPVLIDVDAFGEARVDRMVAEHVGEHRVIHDRLSADPATSDLRAVLALLREHLEEEERYFLSERVLHDSVVSVEASS